MVTLSEANNGHRELLEFFGEIGYPEDHLRVEFPIWMGDRIQRVDVAAFGRAVNADTSTATIVGHEVGHDGDEQRAVLLDAARAVAAPAAVLRTPHQIELWSVSSDPSEHELVDSADHDHIHELIGRFRTALAPEALLAAKRSVRQLHLFPVDVRLLGRSNQTHSSLLTIRIERALADLLDGIDEDKQKVKAKRIVDASRLVIGALAALVIRDKFELDVSNGPEVFQAASQAYPGYFKLIRTAEMQSDKIARILFELGDGVDYRAMDPAIISDVYEDAILSASERRKLGIFYTPSALARRITNQIPFESVAPEDRITLDPACGSGTLLLAAHDRLESLSPANWDVIASHDYLRNHLMGFDTDQFAVEIARLALLLNALPAGNSWRIERRDSRRLTLQPSHRPSFIVSNPPWKDMRSKGGRRHQVADELLDHMVRVLRPGGHLAVVLPVGWLSTETSRSVREKLSAELSVYETWRLPAGTFPSAGLGAAVLFGVKDSTRARKYWAFRRVIQPRNLYSFYRTGKAQETILAKANVAIATNSLLRGPLDAAAKQLTDTPRLRDWVEVKSGPVPEPPATERGGVGDFWWLRRARDLPAFGEAPASSLVRARFPEDFHKAGTHDGSIYLRPKVLVSAKRSPDNPWRLKAALDTRGIIPRESLYMATPYDPAQVSLYGLLAYLSSSFAACWVDQQVTTMAIDSEALQNMPLPPELRGWSKLEGWGRELARLASAGVSRNPEAVSELLRLIDSSVMGYLGLPAPVRRALQEHFKGARGPEGSVRYEDEEGLRSDPADAHVPTRRFGTVLGVESGGVRLWIPGLTSAQGELVELPEGMPGWLAEPEATFEIEAPTEEFDWSTAEFRFQRRAYMSDQELARVFEIS